MQEYGKSISWDRREREPEWRGRCPNGQEGKQPEMGLPLLRDYYTEHTGSKRYLRRLWEDICQGINQPERLKNTALIFKY